MFKSVLEKSEYFDFIVTTDPYEYKRDYESYKLFSVDVTKSMYSTGGTMQSTGVTLNHISLNGYDNFLLSTGTTSGFTQNVKYTINEGERFKLHAVSGYTNTYNYNITDDTINGIDIKLLKGGFYQGLFKLFNYPVEYFKPRQRKGWTVNTLIGSSRDYYTGITTGTTLNDVFDNNGYIFYLGTRAENKFFDTINIESGSTVTVYQPPPGSGNYVSYNNGLITESEYLYYDYGYYFMPGFMSLPPVPYPSGTTNYVAYQNLSLDLLAKLNNNYGFNISANQSFLYTTKPIFTLNGVPYSGYYNIYNGHVYSGRTYDGLSPIMKLIDTGSDLINNCFGVKILPNGKIGYVNIYATDPCYTGTTIDISGITSASFTDVTTECDTINISKIINKYFTIETAVTKEPVIDVNGDPRFLLVSTVFERDISYDTDCALKYGQYKKGTLSIYVNGLKVFNDKNFVEVIPHELETDYRFQEGVPFNLSFGGGTQGLADMVIFDTGMTVSHIIDKFFAGSYVGGVKTIEMFSVPLYITEIRDVVNKIKGTYDLYTFNGGRFVNIKTLL